MSDEQQEIRRFLERLPDTFSLLEAGIDLEIQKEYVEYSHRFGRGELTEEQTLHLVSMLFNPEFPIEGKKKALGLLAHLGTVLAFRQIEKYRKHPDPELTQWSALALQECKMFLESGIMDENSGFIVTGLGGLGDKLRYYFLVLSNVERTFTSSEKETIKSEITRVSEQLNSIVENFDFTDTFVAMTVLIPMDVAAATFIETGINNCNEADNLLFEHYYVTNLNIPDGEEIQSITRIVKAG